MTECILCNRPAEKQGLGPTEASFRYSCPNCGVFIIDSKFDSFAPLKEMPLHLISGYIREKKDMNIPLQTITYDDWKNILESPLIPYNTFAKIEKMLLYYHRITKYFGCYVPVSTSPAIAYAVNRDELENLFNLTISKGYLVREDTRFDRFKNDAFKADQVALTYSGGEIVRSALAKHPENNTSAFVAMWFSDETESAYDDAIKQAIIECGYDPKRIDRVQHNNDITDEIIAGIRKCKFLIADLTGQRAGVYYEAGFARGLDKPVILTCRSDWFDSRSDPQRRVHFDVNHINVIVWDTPSQLKARLIDRIMATII